MHCCLVQLLLLPKTAAAAGCGCQRAPSAARCTSCPVAVPVASCRLSCWGAHLRWDDASHDHQHMQHAGLPQLIKQRRDQ
jgi:hypothetical protein